MITLQTNNSQAVFYPESGALCSSLIFNEQELLYVPKGFDLTYPQAIGAGLPFLFPICGRLENSPLSIHGFAHLKAWRVVAHRSDFIEMSLRHDEHTLSQYPYEFELRLKYTLSETALLCEFTVLNLSERAMPFYSGYHPYFLIPHNRREGAFLDFKPLKRFIYNESLTDVVGEAEALTFPVELSSKAYNEALHLMGEDHGISLSFADGKQLQIETSPELAYTQLYTVYEKPFICIEPWMNHPGALHHQGQCQQLAPGAVCSGEMKIAKGCGLAIP